MAFFGPWWKQPVVIGLAKINRFRDNYRKHRLHDMSKFVPSTGDFEPLPPKPPDDERSADGSYNDPNDQSMGRANTRFGRNVQRNDQFPDPPDVILTPSPREVSRQLMTRKEFKPATSLNLLAAAWIQFEVHDWFSHKTDPSAKPWEVPLQDGDPWGENPMKIRRTQKDPTFKEDGHNHPPTYLNTETHWWDGSQLYGSSLEIQKSIRANEDGKLALTDENLLPLDPVKQVDRTGVNANWWVGLSMLHTLFTKEHNTICDNLRRENPTWGDEKLFQKARLINVALMSKIHTLDWTPAILSHPTTVSGLRGTWYGLKGEESFRENGRPDNPNELLDGIPGTHQEHHSAPYAMTEEFVSVYRMHPLMPDDFLFRRAADHHELESRTLPDVAGPAARSLMENQSLADLFYSFGVSHPGAITLHNYPKFLQTLERPDGRTVDLASIDIMRDRERGVPRYNQFRRRVFKGAYTKFEQITKDPEVVEELRSLYDNDIEKVDLMAGLFAEDLPPSFGFSDTAFRIFSLMAPRRLQSDRFIADSYNSDVYTASGIDWIENNSFRTVLLRHMPELAAALGGGANPFAPWLHADS